MSERLETALGSTDVNTIRAGISIEEWEDRVDRPLREQEIKLLEMGRRLLGSSGAVELLSGVQKKLTQDGVTDAKREHVSSRPNTIIDPSLRSAISHTIPGNSEKVEYRIGRAGSVITEIGWNYMPENPNSQIANTHNVIAVSVFTATGDLAVNFDGSQQIPRRLWETISGKTLLAEMIASAYKNPLRLRTEYFQWT